MNILLKSNSLLVFTVSISLISLITFIAIHDLIDPNRFHQLAQFHRFIGFLQGPSEKESWNKLFSIFITGFVS